MKRKKELKSCLILGFHEKTKNVVIFSKLFLCPFAAHLGHNV